MPVMIVQHVPLPHTRQSPPASTFQRTASGNFSRLGRHLRLHDTLRRAVVALEQFGHADPAAAIDMLVMHHDAVGSFGQPSDTPKHVIACGGAEGEGPTPACAITAWTIRARYLLAESVL